MVGGGVNYLVKKRVGNSISSQAGSGALDPPGGGGGVGTHGPGAMGGDPACEEMLVTNSFFN